MKTPSRLLCSAMALAMSLGITACSGEKKAEDAKAEDSAQVLKIATEGAYPPMNLTNADGSLGGFDVDVANALCEQMETKCDIVAQEWEGIIPGLQANKYDAIIAGMSITDERKQAVDFTDPYFSSGLLLIAKADADLALDSLDGKNIGVQKATVASTYLEENSPKATLKLYDTQDNVNVDLTNGRLDGIVVDQVVGTDWLTKDEAKGFEQKGDSISTGKDDFGIAVRKGDAELTDKFNKALAEIKANGTYETISKKYFKSADAVEVADTEKKDAE